MNPQSKINMTIAGAPMVGTSMGASFNSDPQELFYFYSYSVQIAWSAGTSPVGAFSIQASLDYNPGGNLVGGDGTPLNAGTWTTVTGSSQAISGTPGNILYDVVQCSYRWMRVAYTRTSGSATLSEALIQLKGI